MKRDYFSQAPRSDRRFGEQRSGTCMALIDGRFLIWMAQQGALGATGESVNRQGLLSLLSQALAHSALDVDLKRIYWYSDRSDGLVIDDQIVRLVQAHDADAPAAPVQYRRQRGLIVVDAPILAAIDKLPLPCHRC